MEEPTPSRFPAAHKRLAYVAVLYMYRALSGFALAFPFAVAVEQPLSGYPRGALEVLDPGGILLLEVLRVERSALKPLPGSLALVLAVVGLLPMAALLVSLGHTGRLSARRVVERAARRIGTLALLGLGFLVLQALVATLGLVLGYKLIAYLALAPDRELVVALGLVAIGCVLAALVGMVRDIAWAAAVHNDAAAYSSGACAVRSLRGGRVVFAWAWRMVLGMGALVLTAALAPSSTRASAVALGTAWHQVGIFAVVFARASWFAAAVASVSLTSKPSSS
jgi:hypothetical protein